MKKLFLLIIASGFAFSMVYSQEAIENYKECTLSAGFGFAGAPINTSSLGKAGWLQLDYLFAKNFSVALEGENSTFKQHGYYPNLLAVPDEIGIYDYNFSLLAKYHLDPIKKLRIAVGSGWSYNIRADDYFYFSASGTSTSYTRRVNYAAEYRIPFLLQLEYPLYKKLNLQTRFRYNISTQMGASYSTGLALSVKL